MQFKARLVPSADYHGYATLTPLPRRRLGTVSLQLIAFYTLTSKHELHGDDLCVLLRYFGFDRIATGGSEWLVDDSSCVNLHLLTTG
jgi:hypothetical protein